MTIRTLPTGDEYPAVISRTTRGGQPWYMASHPDLPGCMSDGATPQEALENLSDARELYIQAAQEDGLELPAPFSTFSPTVGTTGGSFRKKARIVRGQAMITQTKGSIELVEVCDPIAIAI